MKKVMSVLTLLLAGCASPQQSPEVKAVCGDDYRKLKRGMSVERLQQCAGSHVSTVMANTYPEGKVTIYKTHDYPVYYVRAIDGKVDAWSTSPYYR